MTNSDKYVPRPGWHGWAARVRCFPLLLAAPFLCGFAGPSQALHGADVALYNDSTAPYYNGAWQDGLTAIRNMLATIGLSYEEINYWDLDTSFQDFSSLYKIILMPGGYAPYYNYWINRTGKDRIRAFVQSGGAYFGICAGAYFACDTVTWGDTVYDDDAGYDLDLFPGSAMGDIGSIADYYAGNWTMTTLNFTAANSILRRYKTVPYTEDLIFLGGPSFVGYEQYPVTVLASFASHGRPGIVAFPYGSGRVILSGPHPEIEEDSARDGVTLSGEDQLDDRGSDWDFTLHLVVWLAYPQSNPIMDIPMGQTTFAYTPVVTPSRSAIPADARPVGLGPVATNGNELAISISLYQFMTPVDMYFGYSAADDPATIHILRPDGALQPMAEGLIPFQASVLDPVAVSFGGGIPIAAIRPGTYTLYFAAAPAGRTDAYYLWTTTLTIPGS
ncbi:MAG: hypothetical protein HYV35_04435 [Lentisphaerae bacterium]|nr:hypothetical protein [Lentisphaerota bacterium]